MIPDQVLQEIAAANDIVETVGAYVTLKKGGKDYKGLCPFHNEKTASFTVSPGKQIFHCFGCGAGGDVFGFVMKMEKMEFPEAIEFLAQKKSIDLSAYKSQDRQGSQSGLGKTRLFEINQAAKAYFQANLKEHAEPQQYFKKRGVTGITARDFGLGWALPGWDGLLRWGLQKGFTQKELAAAGLIVPRENNPGQYYDRFRARVIFPLHDTQGRVLAFSGRVLDDTLPKYINSPETAVFTKGATLFGLNMAKDSAMKQGWVAVCEGPLDMICVYQAGIRNIVASQGTAFTQRHAKLIKRFTNRVMLCFDGDQAGQLASLRSLDAFLAEEMDVRIAVLPPKEDPDSFVRAKGAAAMQELLLGAVDFLTFRLNLLKKSMNVSTEIGKAQAAKLVLADLAKLPSAVYQNTCIQRLAEWLGVREESLWLEFKKINAPAASAGASKDNVLASGNALRGSPAWEMDWVSAVVQHTELLNRESRNENFEQLSDPVLSGIVRTAVGQWKMSAFIGIASLSVLFHGREESEILAGIVNRPIPDKDVLNVYEEGLLRFKKRGLETAIRKLTADIERLEREKEDVSDLLGEIAQAKKELLRMSKDAWEMRHAV